MARKRDAWRRFDHETREKIRAHGWAVIGVFDARPSFGYTVGMADYTAGVEFLVAGMHPIIAAELLNMLGERARHEIWRPNDGEVLTGFLEDDYACKLALMTDDHPCNVARRLNGLPFVAMQLLLPDEDNVLPDDPACSAEMYEMQVVPGSPFRSVG